MKNFGSTVIGSLGKATKLLSRKGLNKFLVKEYAQISPGAAVLTVGAGGEVNRILQDYAIQRTFKVISLDIDSQRNPDIMGDICYVDLDDAMFDVVVMSEVLEHVHSPHLAVSNVYGALKQNGKLILSTPFIFPIHGKPSDYYRFTRYGLEFLLKDFKTVEVKERNSYFEAIDVLWVRLWQISNQIGRLLLCLTIPLILVKTPISILLGKIFRTNAMTTGYITVAVK